VTEIELAVSTQVFAEREVIREHLQIIRTAGFRVVEVFAAPGHFAWDNEHAVTQMAGWLRSLDMSVCSVHAPWAPGQDIAALDDRQRERSLQAVERAADALLCLDGRYLILHPGATLSDPKMKEKQLGLAAEGIARVARYCAARRLTIALENPPPYELGGDTNDMLRLYEHFASDQTVQACFDTGHAHITPADVAGIALVPKDVTVIHLSDNTGKSDDHWPPPQGTIGWADFFALLADRRWSGYLVLELTDRPDAPDVLAEGWRWLNAMLAGQKDAL
jgi:sugar phosphate isomerase/epimerase